VKVKEMIQKACAEEVAAILDNTTGKDGLNAVEIQKCRVTAKQKVLKKLGIKQ